MRAVLVTGGRGFIGRHVVSRFAGAGFRVRVLTRDPEASEPAAGESEAVQGDVRDRKDVGRAVEGSHLVVHLASDFHTAGASLAESRAVNVNGMMNVLEAARERGVERVVHCSTIGVHGSLDTVPGDEDSPLKPDDVPYELTKAEAERELWAFHRRTGLAVSALRPTGVYGPGDLRLLKLFRMVDRGRFVMVGKGDALTHLVYVKDLADAFYQAAHRPEALGEAFIIGGPSYLPIRDFVGSVVRALDAPPPRVRLPLAPLKVAAVLCEVACRPFGIEPPLHRRRLGFFTSNRAFSIDKARHLLGWEPATPLPEGLERTVAWYRAEGYLEPRSEGAAATAGAEGAQASPSPTESSP